MYIKFILKLVILIIVFEICSLSKVANIADAAYFNLGIYPPVISVTTKPPASFLTPITLVNLSDQDVTGTIVFRLFTPGEYENGQLEYLPLTTNPSPDKNIFNKIKIISNGSIIKNFTLAPKQQQKLNLQIDISKDEPLGDYYFSIIFLSSNSIASSNTSSSTLGGVATNVLLSIGPKGSARAQVIQFSAPSFLSQGPVPFIIRVKNTGEHAIEPTGYVIVTNMFGQTIGKINLLPVDILAGSTRSIPDITNSQAVPSSNLYLPNIPIAIWPEKFLLGPYKATVLFSLSDNGPIIEKNTNFFAFPIKFIFLLLLIIGFAVFIFLRIKKYLNRA